MYRQFVAEKRRLKVMNQLWPNIKYFGITSEHFLQSWRIQDKEYRWIEVRNIHETLWGKKGHFWKVLLIGLFHTNCQIILKCKQYVHYQCVSSTCRCQHLIRHWDNDIRCIRSTATNSDRYRTITAITCSKWQKMPFNVWFLTYKLRLGLLYLNSSLSKTAIT